ncbi:MAG: hypothetical protein R3C54_05645 [Parvularculaceae bacterium]
MAQREEDRAPSHGAGRDARCGTGNKRAFLAALSADADFAGDVSTRYIDEHSDALFAKPARQSRARGGAFLRHSEATKNLSNDPWSALVGFRLNKPAKSVYWVEVDGAPAIARLVEKAEGFDVTIEPNATAAIRREGGASGEPFTFSFSAEKIGDIPHHARWRSSPPPPCAMARACASSSARTPSISTS